MRRHPLFAALACLLAASCRMQAPPAQPAPTPPRCAILFSESNLDFTRTAEFTGGPAAYSNLLAALRAALNRKGISADFVSEADIENDRLCGCPALVIADTFSISAEAEEAIRWFVAHGGLLVGLNEVGRIQGGWTSPWHYEDLFGVKALAVDPFGTALTWDGGLFRIARVTDAGQGNPLLADLGKDLDFGPASSAAWVTRPATARVLAEFPAYLKRAPAPDEKTTRVDAPFVAVSVNDFQAGKAVWIAPNVHGRDPTAWTNGGIAVELVARAVRLAKEAPSVPRRPPVTILGVSQIGYAPGEKKTAIVRVPREISSPFTRASFRVRADSATILEGELREERPPNAWGDHYFIADLSGLTAPGTYRFSARLEGPRGRAELTAPPFRVATGLWTSVVVPSQYAFFHGYRCGGKCHLSDPVRGGYHDATGDYAIRMWSMPHVAYGMAENILFTPALPPIPFVEPADELRFTVDWLLAMLDAGGWVNLSVKPPDDGSPISRRPADDPTRRVIEKGQSLNYQTTYIVGLAHAARALRGLDPERAAAALAAAQKAHAVLLGRDWKKESSGEIGNHVWGCTELFRATADPSYLDEARRVTPLILQRQLLVTNAAQAGLHGDFFDRPNARSFGDRQYKKFHQLGLYMGLVELAGLLPEGDPLKARVSGALDLYFAGHLLRGAALTPYGQMITALEPGTNAEFRIRFFTHPASWVRLHGLNVDHLAMGLVALKYAQLTGREDLRDFARRQAQWVVGFNPLGFCMIASLGGTNPPVIDDAVGTGRLVGGIPNGIVGDRFDRPTWGSTWDSREYWIPHNAYLLAIAPHLDAASGACVP